MDLHSSHFAFVLSTPSRFKKASKNALRLRPALLPYRAAVRRSLVAVVDKPPPKVKSSFYKNPSKAIEKGGGFYFPGLRGPRLRVFVSSVALTLLSLNHLASQRGAVSPPLSFSVSELLALFAVACVGTSAYLDVLENDETNKSEDETETQFEAATMRQTDDSAPDTNILSESLEEAMEWVNRVAAQMTGMDGLYVFDGDLLAFARGAVKPETSRGEVVSRVARENKSVYVDDSRKLPTGVDMPFLDAEQASGWRAFLVPIQGGKRVVVFTAALKESVERFELGAADRRWLAECVSRIDEEW